MYRLGFCLCVILSPFVYPLKLHELLTHDDVLEIFQTPNDTEIHYEITFPTQKIRKRSTEKVFNVSYQEKNIFLYLHPNEGYLVGEHTKVWMAQPDSKSPYGFQFNRIPNAMENFQDFYFDEINRAAVQVQKDDNGNTLLDGIIGENIMIRPVPKKYLRNSDFGESVPEKNLLQSGRPHIVIKRSFVEKSQTKFSPHAKRNKFKTKKVVRKKPNFVTDVVYPELLIFIDEPLFFKLGRDVQKTVTYMTTLYYAVDLRYRALSNPKVRLSIAGIVIINGFSSFMESFIETREPNMFSFLTDFSSYLPKIKKHFQFKKDYDIAIYMTGLDIMEINMYGTSSSPILGLGYIRGACKSEIIKDGENKVEFIKSSAIATDNGGYFGIFVAAHELAHVLGAPHDPIGEDAPKDCKWGRNGYIMSYFGATSQRVKFSPCSQVNLRKFLLSDQAKCLYNPPAKDYPIPVPLPGKLLSLDKQCLIAEGTGFCVERKDDPDICAKLFCINPNIEDRKEDPCTEVFSPPAEGTRCGNNDICINGHCVPYWTRWVPQYTYTR